MALTLYLIAFVLIFWVAYKINVYGGWSGATVWGIATPYLVSVIALAFRELP